MMLCGRSEEFEATLGSKTLQILTCLVCNRNKASSQRPSMWCTYAVERNIDYTVVSARAEAYYWSKEWLE